MTTNTDRFGNGINSNSSKINAVLTAKPQTAKQIADASGAKLTHVYAHLRTLVGKGFVTSTAEGWYTVMPKTSKAKKVTAAKPEKPATAAKKTTKKATYNSLTAALNPKK